MIRKLLEPPQKVRTNIINCLNLNFENQRLVRYSSFLRYCNLCPRGFDHELTGYDFPKSAYKALNEAFEYLPQNVGPGLIFYRILHIVDSRDATLYQENFFVQLQKNINTNLIAKVSIMLLFHPLSCEQRVDRSPLSPDGTLSFLPFFKRIVFQSTGGISLFKASTYQNILVYRTYDTRSSRLPQFSKPFDLSSSDRLLRSLARCKVANDVTPKT